MDDPRQSSAEAGREATDRQFAAEVLDILVNAAGTEAVRRNLDLQLYKSQLLDSLQTVELIVAFEERFALEISLAEFERENWATPRKIIFDLGRRKHR